MSNQTVSTSEGETVLQLSDVVCVVVNNPLFVDVVIPMILDDVLEAMRSHVEQIVSDQVQSYIETMENTKYTVLTPRETETTTGTNNKSSDNHNQQIEI